MQASLALSGRTALSPPSEVPKPAKVGTQYGSHGAGFDVTDQGVTRQARKNAASTLYAGHPAHPRPPPRLGIGGDRNNVRRKKFFRERLRHNSLH